MIANINNFKILKDYQLWLQFDDGKSGTINIAKVITFQGIFAPLKNENYFKQVVLDKELGTICWQNGADIAPEFLYDNIK